MRTKTPINLIVEMEKALQQLLEELTKPESERKMLWRQEWFTATELERTMRENLNAGYWSGRKITGLGGRPLLYHCRDFLRDKVLSGVLRADNPSGYRTCTGLRFRAVDGQFSKAEQETMELPVEERRRRRHIRHLTSIVDGKRKAKCRENVVRKGWSCYRQKPIWTTNNPSEVNCKKCLKILEKDLQSTQNVVRYNSDSNDATV